MWAEFGSERELDRLSQRINTFLEATAGFFIKANLFVHPSCSSLCDLSELQSRFEPIIVAYKRRKSVRTVSSAAIAVVTDNSPTGSCSEYNIPQKLDPRDAPCTGGILLYRAALEGYLELNRSPSVYFGEPAGEGDSSHTKSFQDWNP
jgi:hypothetical protein